MSLPTRLLRKGSNGTDVVVLQERLNTHLDLRFGNQLIADGAFGTLTNHATTSFQSQNGLSVDGIVGQRTWAKISELDEGGQPDVTVPKSPVAKLPIPKPPTAPPSHGGGRVPRESPTETPVPKPHPLSTIRFRRTGVRGAGGSILGEITYGGRTWATIERGNGYTFVRKGTYVTKMDVKGGDRKDVKCLRFDESWAIRTHLVHDALNDNHLNLTGCIAPGTLNEAGDGIVGSKEASNELMAALGGFAGGRAISVIVENNIVGNETKEQWIRRREGR